MECSSVPLLSVGGTCTKLRKATMSVCPPARMKELGTQWTDFIKFDILLFLEKCVGKIQVLLQCDSNNEYFTLRPIYAFLIIFRSLILRIRNDADKNFRENSNTNIYSVFSFSENRILYF